MRCRVPAVVAATVILATVATAPSIARSTQPQFGWTTNTIELTAATEAVLGVSPAALSTYAPFDEPFPMSWAAESVRRAVPLVVSWEPWDSDVPLGVDQPAYSLARIAAGAHDDYARAWARDAAASGATVLLRFAAEMNGDWHAWSRGDSPTDFRRAWRHLHDIFVAEGAEQVRWVFNPNNAYPGSTTISAFWPGAAYVDWLAVDGYNWTGVLPHRDYESAAEVFTDTVRQLRKLGPGLPIMIAECGAGPDAKETWLRDLAAEAPRLGVSLVIWFEHDKETDWRLATAALATPVPQILREAGWRLDR